MTQLNEEHPIVKLLCRSEKKRDRIQDSIDSYKELILRLKANYTVMLESMPETWRLTPSGIHRFEQWKEKTADLHDRIDALNAELEMADEKINFHKRHLEQIYRTQMEALNN